MKKKYSFRHKLCLLAAALAAFVLGAFFCPPDAQAVQVKKIQRGNVYFDLDDTSIPVAIDSVDQTKSMILLYVNADSITGSADTTASQNMLFSALFEANNSIVVDRAGATYGATVTYYIVEFADGVTVQRGISSFLYGSYNNTNYRIKDVTLPQSLDNYQNAFVVVQTRSAMTVSTAEQMTEVSGQLLDNNNFRLERSSSADNNKSINIVWQVVEFKTDASLQTGENSIGVSAVSNISTLGSAIGDLNKAFLMFGNRAKTATGGQEGRYYTMGRISNNTTINFTRGYQNALANTELYQRWTTIELTDPSSLVQTGTVLMGSAVTDTLVSLGTAVDDTRSIPVYTQFANGTTTTSTYEPMLKLSAEFDGPRRICYDSGSNAVWTANYYSDSVTKYNATTGAVVGTYLVGANPVSICYDSTNNAVWTANYYQNSVTKLNATTGAVVNANITVGTNPIYVAYAPNSNQVWTVNYGAAAASGVSRIYANNGTFVSNNTTATTQPTSICYDPAGYMWAVYLGSRVISRFNSTNGARTDSGNIFAASEGPIDITFAQTNGTSLGYNSVWVSMLRSNNIWRVRSPAYNTTNSFPVDISPRGSVWDSSTSTMWVVSYGEDTLTKLIANNTTTGSDIALNSTTTDVNPYGIAFDSVNNKIWVANSGENTVQRFSTSAVLEGTYKKSATEDKLAMARVNTGAAVDINWYVVEFAPMTLKTPNGGGFYRVNQTVGVNWTFADSAKDHDIDLQLNTNNSTNISNYTLPINTTINMSYNSNGTNYGLYNWTIPESISSTNLIGTQVRLGVIDNNLSARNYDYSNSAFEIKGDLNLTAPNGGEAWKVGELHYINWTRYGNLSAQPFNITISDDGGQTWSVLNNSVNQSAADADGDGNCVYNWTISDNDLMGNGMRIQVAWAGDPSYVKDNSTGNFSVWAKLNVTEPTASTEWLAYGNGTINWTKNGTWPGNNVNIYYRIGAGSENLISTENASNSTYNWVNITPSAISSGNTYIILRSAYDANNIYNVSPAFTVHPNIEVTYPNTNDVVWNVTDSPVITWNMTGNMSTVDIWYNNTTGWTKIKDDANATGGNWTWSNIPASYASETVTIRVAKHTTGATPIIPFDDANYSIPIRGKITVTRPAPGDTFRVNDTEAINWNISGFSGGDLVRIKFSRYGNFADPPNTFILASNENAVNQTFSWTNIPNNVTTTGKIRVEWQTNTTVFNDSDSFSVKGKLNVVAPANGSGYYINGTLPVNWTATGTVGATQINYSADGGSDGYNHSVLNSTGGADFNESGPYDWLVPEATDIGSLIRFKVFSKNDAANVSAVSGNVTIRGLINLTAPDGGEVWQVNSTGNITWTRQGSKMGNIVISYSANTNGTNYTGTVNASVNSTGEPPGTYKYVWTIPDVITNPAQKFDLMKIRVAVIGDESGTLDNSSNPFTIVPRIQITRPDFINNTFYVDDNQSVNWTTDGTLDKVNLYRSSDGGGNWSLINTENFESNDGSYLWGPVPNVISNITRVKACSYYYNETPPEACGQSVNFTVQQKLDIDTPLAGSIAVVGKVYTISWTPHGTLGTVNISYANFSSGWTYAEINNTNSGNYFNWTVPDDMGANTSKIKIISEVYPEINNTSAAFSIRGDINLTQPAGGANVFANSNDTPIRWTYNGSKIGLVNIEYSLNGGGGWSILENDVPVSSGTSYVWPLAPTTSIANARVKVYDKNDTNTFSNSTNFNIVPNLKLTSHNGGSNAAVGSTQYVTWTQAASSLVNVYYSLNNGSNWTLIETVNPGVNSTMTTNWLIDNTTSVSNQAKIRIEDNANANVSYSLSTSNFSVIGVFNVTHPESGDIAYAGEYYNVTWDKNRTVGISNVLLEYRTNDTNSWVNIANASNASETVPNLGYYEWLAVPGDVLTTEGKVRVTDPGNVNATDMGASYFEIRGRLNIAKPNGAESWQIYESQPINWTKQGNISTVSIRYSWNNGTNWTTLASSIAASNLTWSWSIADTMNTSSLALINISDSGNPNNVFDASNNTFELRGAINLTTPDASGIVLAYDGGISAYNINWTLAGGISQVNLSYATDGTNFINPIANNVSAAGLTYSWTIPNEIGTSLKVKVKDSQIAAVNDSSTNNFSIKGSILLTRPNGNDSFVKGTTEAINWTPRGSYPGTVDFYYSNDSGGNWTMIGSAAAGADNVGQSWNWTPVPDDITANAKIKAATNVSSTIDVNDSSNGTFKVKGYVLVTQPNGNELWYYNEAKQIKWTATGTVNPVKIEYSTDNGGNWSLINNTVVGVDGANSYNWTVGDLKSEQCLIKVSDNRSSFSDVTDVSNNTFKIRPQITMTQPVSLQNVVAKSNDTAIRWTYTGNTITQVNVDYSTNDGINWTNIVSNEPVSSGSSYVWPQVPITTTPDGRVRVVDVDNANVTNTSAKFNIVSSLNLTSHNGGSNAAVGSTQYIGWSQAAAGLVNVYYSLNNGTNWTLIESVNPGSNSSMTTNWVIDNGTSVSNLAKVRIEDNANANVSYSVSASNFSVIGVFNVTNPESGNIAYAGEYYNVTWDNNRTVGISNVLLEYRTNDSSGWINIANASNASETVPNLGYYEWLSVPGDVLTTAGKIRVTDPGNINATDMGAGYFEIRGRLNVVKPNGAESWQIYETRPVNWTKQGNISTVSIRYSWNNGTNWTTLASSIAASNLTWSWSIADTMNTSGLGLINISDSGNPNNVFDSSNNTFELRGAINLTTPDASGIVLTYDGGISAYNINWTMAGSISQVNLSYATNGVNFINPIENNVSAAALTYTWTVPDAIGTTLKVKIRDSQIAAVNDSSTDNFVIKGSILLTRPNGNESFVKGATEAINWTPRGSYPGTVDFYYSNDSGGNWSLIGSAAAGADNIPQSWNWSPVPDDINPNAKIKVATNVSSTIDVNDSSNGTFKVKGYVLVTQPNGNELWYYNEAKQIKWTATGTVNPVKIEYSTDNGGNWTLINNTVAGIDGVNTYNWTVGDLKSEQCLIKVSDNRSSFSDVTDVSNNTFKIRPQITVTQPVTGQNVVVSSTDTPVRWTYTGNTINLVNVQFSVDGGVNWTNVETSVPVTSGSSYIWPLAPAVKTPNALVKVFDTDNANVTDDSGIFNIVGNLKVLTPNGNENWNAGSTRWISWSSTQVSSVQSYYSLNNGTNWTAIGAAVPAGDGGVNWSISNTSQVSNVALVKLEDTTNTVVNDTSNSTFAIIAGLEITGPESGTPVIAEEPYNVTWTKKGSGADNIILEYRTNDTNSWINVANASNNTTTIPNTGTYFWSSVPGDALSSYCKVRIYDPNNLNSSNEGADYFPLRGNVTVTQPDGFEIWEVGTTRNITWLKNGNISTVEIKYSYDNGSYYNVTLASGISASNLSWPWSIGNATTLAAQGKIKILDSSDPTNVFDVSNNSFEVRGRIVVNTPSSANLTLKVNDNYNITWTPYGAVQFVNLAYSANSLTGPWVSIISNLSAVPSSYGWQVPDAIGNNLRVKVVDSGNPNVVNYSDNDFRIIGKVDIVKPDVAEPDWVVGTGAQIQWMPTGNFSFVKIEGSTNAFANENQTWYIDTVSAGLSGQLQVYNYSSVADKLSTNVKIRVSDSLRSSEVYNMSIDPFKIKGKLELITPNSGSEIWVAGTQPTATPIQWLRTGSIANIKIEYSPDMGGSWLTVTNSTDASTGAFSNWTVPDSAVRASKQALIRVADVTEPSVNDTSNNTFLIKGNLNLTAPASQGLGLVVNNTYNITWTKSGVYTPTDTVKIEYSKNDGAYQSLYNVLNQSADAADASQGYFSWYVPDDLSSNIKVKITRNADTINVAPITSPQVKIIGSLLVTPSPSAGMKWEANKTYPIQWTRQGSISNVTLSYSQDGQNYTFVDYASGASGGSGYNWLIPNTPGILSTNVTVKVADTSDPTTVYNISPVFGIVPRFVLTAPVFNQQVNVSRDASITWNSFGWNPAVNIYYSTNNFTGGNGTVLIQANASNNGNYTWAVPDVLSNNIQVRVSYPADESAYNDSPVFRTVPGYEVASPYSSTYDKWQVGRIHQIKWNCTSASSPNVKIYYSVNSGSSYPYLIDSNASNAGAVNGTRVYNWSVNDTITSGFKVKIQDADSGRSDIAVESPYNSKIMGYLNVTYPDGNEVFAVNDSFNLQWDRSGTVPAVKLEISKDDFGNSTVITNSTANNGNYPWAIPDIISTTVKVRVSDVNDSDASSVSQDYFKIHGFFNVSNPSGGERLPIAYNSTLRWNTTGSIDRVKIVAYSALGANDSRFAYAADSPYVINANYSSNTGNGQTNYTWMAPDNATAYARIRVIDYNDPSVFADSNGNFSLIGSFTVTSPDGGQAWIVGATQNITWNPTGSSINEARISYSVNGTNGPWYNITDTWNNTSDGIVNNNGTYPWVVPDAITANSTAYIKIEDPYDSTVNDTSDAGFKIRGNFSISSPSGSERWVTNENKTLSWNTTGSIGKVNILYSRDNFSTNNTAVSNLTCSQGANSYAWSIPDSLAVYGINSSSLPVSVKVRVVDANDSVVYADAPAFNMDYYSTTWHLRDFLSSLPIAGGLSVNDTLGWLQSGLASPVSHKTPYGNWDTAWTHQDYGDAAYRLLADRDQNVTMYLESKVVHVWEARTDFVYDTAADKLSFKGYLIRDGSIAGSRDANGTFNTLATNCTVEIYDAAGTQIKTVYTANVTSAGFFSLEWNTTGLNTSLAYNAINEIDTSLGGKFRTPFSINLAPIASLYNAASLISSRIDVPMTAIQANMTAELSNQTSTINSAMAAQQVLITTKMDNQTQLITTKMDQQIGVIENKTAEMQTSVNQTLSSFESRTYKAIDDLQVGANQTINASLQALNATDKLEATAKKYSWAVSVSPNPVLVGDTITLTCQGEPSLLPLLTIYSWDNKYIMRDQFLTEKATGLYETSFKADSRFAPGKAYTYMVTEQKTGGLVAGSGVVESMSITTIAGLAAAAPEAERAAKKALDAIKAVEAMMTSGGEGTNIALALKNLKSSVDSIPDVIAKEGPAAKINKTVEDISSRIKTLFGEQGYDISAIFEHILSESPTISDIKAKTGEITAASDIMLEIMERKLGGREEPFVSVSLF